MKQKTFYTDKHLSVGDVVLLIGRQRDGEKEVFTASKKFAGTGYPGNLNENIYRFHGWRGTSYGVSVHVYGVRRVEHVEETKKENEFGEPVYKVRVGKDLHPDYE